ncbi:MAG: AAA family ATPase [Candidatus Lokiarchaeota archaeon]|nr:AAA family ATPase [Candidatus Lokiarchaeota archaeon]
MADISAINACKNSQSRQQELNIIFYQYFFFNRLVNSLPEKKSLTIAISGKAGAGKSTFAKRIAEIFKLEHVSAGKIFRQMAQQRNMDLSTFSRFAENNIDIDKEIDERSIKEAKKGNVVLDGHLTAWICKDLANIKIFVTAPLDVRAKRIAQRDENSYEDALSETTRRENSERMRYKKIYNIDITELSIFDIILNTDNWSIDSITNILITAIREFKGGDK